MKSYVGIDLGHDRLKLAYVKGNKIVKLVVEPMLDNLVKDGYILSPEACGKFLKETMQHHKIKCANAAIMIPENCMYVRNVSMPQMTGEQLLCNIPYEFRDYISEKDSSFLFDYVVLGTHEGEAVLDENGVPTGKMTSETVDIMAVAIKKKIMEDVHQTVKIAGMKLVKAAPEIVIYREFIKKQSDYTEEKEQCILDLGYDATRMYMFKGANLMATRIIDRGIRSIEYVISEKFNMDVHLAGSYLQSNYQGYQYCDECIESYEGLALEIARALKFYKFSNQESELENILIWGGGSSIAPLVDSIRNTVSDMKIQSVSGYLPQSASEVKSIALMALEMTFLSEGREAYSSLKNKKTNKNIINLAMIGYKPFNFKVAIPASIAIIIMAYLISKFTVIDRIDEINQLKGELADIKLETHVYNEKIKGFGKLVELYAHYTYQDFEEEELKRADRADMISLIDERIAPKCQVGDWSIVENTLTINVVCKKLSDINLITSDIKKDKKVDYCTVSTASSNDKEYKKADKVTGTIVIAFKDGALYDKAGFKSSSQNKDNTDNPDTDN